MKHSAATKKLALKLEQVLATLNEQLNAQLAGYSHLEHTVQYDHFPGSLLVSCYFVDQESLQQAQLQQRAYQQKLQGLLLKKGVLLKNAQQNLHFHLSKAST